MYLYNLTLQRATGITTAIHGNFSGSKVQEILISHGKSLELVRPDPNTGKVHTLLQLEIFGVIRSMMAFRLTGSTKGKISSSFIKLYAQLFCLIFDNLEISRKLMCYIKNLFWWHCVAFDIAVFNSNFNLNTLVTYLNLFKNKNEVY